MSNEFFDQQNTTDLFSALMQQEGKIYRQVKRRKTIRFVKNNTPYYAKLFWGISFAEFLKNIIKCQSPVLDASHEMRALTQLSAAGIDVPKPVAYETKGNNPLRRKSFIVMSAVEPAISLEDYAHKWSEKPLSMRRALINKTAEIARKIHEQGVQHRDFYICHFLLKTPQGEAAVTPENISISVIDWHRARFKKPLPRRWRIKDLSALFFSALSAPLTQRDYYRFLKVYTKKPLREVLAQPEWKVVKRRACRLYKKTYSTLPRIFKIQNTLNEHDRYIQQENFYKRLIVDKSVASPELMHLLGDPESIFTRPDATIIADNKLATSARIKVNGKDVLVKRYRWRQGITGISRLFRPSRGARSWKFSHLLIKHNILTPKPLALVEKRWGWLRRDSYYVTEFYHADSLRETLKNQQDKGQLEKFWQQWEKIHQQLTEARLSHGDTNHQNFLMTEKGLMVVDLDTMRYHLLPFRLSRRKKRDYRRFLREWPRP